MKEKLKKIFIEIYDTSIWLIFFISIPLIFLYLLLPIVTFYFNLYKIKSLSKDFNGMKTQIINKNNFKEFNNFGDGSEVQVIDLKNINSGDEKINKIKEIVRKLKENKNNKFDTLERLRNLIRKNRKKKNNQDKNEEIKNKEKTESNLLNKLPLEDLILSSDKIYINGEFSSLVYRDINKNIQKDLWENSVISIFDGTPIIFTHSSGGKYNFGLYYLYLKKGNYIYLEGNYNGLTYYIEGEVKEIFKNIPGNKLYDFLVDLSKKYTFNRGRYIYLDTCELNWTKRRILVVKIKSIYFK